MPCLLEDELNEKFGKEFIATKAEIKAAEDNVRKRLQL